MNKYRNRKTIIDGITFDSRREAERYRELRLMEKANLILHLELQPVYELQAKFRHNGKTERAITYKADFRYEENGRIVVEDVKGMETEVFKIKRKLFLYRYPDIDFRIVK